MNREDKLKKIIEEIKNDEENKKYTEQGLSLIHIFTME